jgi:geranylgeranyl reductase family protein
MKKVSVCIVGAGPAGAFAALFLSKLGIESVFVDKARFPRDKICGDGISGWVLTILNELDKDLLLRLSNQPFVAFSHGIRIVAPNYKQLDLPFFDSGDWDPSIPPGFTARRIDFDNFMINEVKNKKEVELLEETEITGYKRSDNKIRLSTKSGADIEAKIVIFANGATSKFMNKPGNITKTKKFTMSGIKTYYKGVTGFHKDNYVELHFLKDFLPGYFWIFPVPGGLANVGVGLDQYRIAKRKINLKNAMYKAIEEIPYLKERFKNAEQVTKVEAWPLPLWDKKRRISGDNFMLAGDAANLIDPVTGEGMGHAAISGMFAAYQVERALKANDFSAEFMKNYDDEVYDKIGKELNISSKIPRFIKYPWLFNAVINKTLSSDILRVKLTQAMTDLEIRKELKNPMLYLKVLMGR